MRWKNAFIYTLREDPSDAETISHKLMTRAAMIQKVGAGIYDYLPLGLRVIRKIEGIIREEMERAGAAELLMPVVIPAELWQESGRWQKYGAELLRITDRKNNSFCLGPTHEEVVLDIARKAVKSYRDLPTCLYQIQTKFRDETRPRYGLMRGREFIMKDGYSFHASDASLDEFYVTMHEVYTRIFSRMGLNFRPVEADSGAIGGDVTHEFHVLAESGEDTIVFCDSCNYAANLEKAVSKKVETTVSMPADAPAPVEVHTPGKKGNEEVAALLGIRVEDTIKFMVYKIDGEYFVAAMIRGDQEVNEIKLKNFLHASTIELPEESELAGLAVGYMGAHKFDRKGLIREIIADTSIASMGASVVGANKPDYHLTGAWPARDLDIDRSGDIGFAHAGECCARCGSGILGLRKGIEVGQIFKLGKKYSTPMGMTFLDEAGAEQTVIMGCYGIGVGRTAAASIEQNWDKDGIIWPVEIAPFEVGLLCLDPNNVEVKSVSERLYAELKAQGVDVLLDDRDDRPGVKFKDADLIGLPIRMVVGGKGLAEGIVEVRRRREGTVEKIPLAEVVSHVSAVLSALRRV